MLLFICWFRVAQTNFGMHRHLKYYTTQTHAVENGNWLLEQAVVSNQHIYENLIARLHYECVLCFVCLRVSETFDGFNLIENK